jgi:hypothetical protein
MNTNIVSPVTLRLDPKLAYGLKLLARKRHQTVSKLLRQIIKDAIEGKYGDGV